MCGICVVEAYRCGECVVEAWCTSVVYRCGVCVVHIGAPPEWGGVRGGAKHTGKSPK
jgi:hypothetical protein